MPHQLAVRGVVVIGNGREHVSEDLRGPLHRRKVGGAGTGGATDRADCRHSLESTGEVKSTDDLEHDILAK